MHVAPVQQRRLLATANAQHMLTQGARPAHAQQRCVRALTGPSRDELVGVDHDCNDIPDAAMTLAVAALFAKGPTRIRNVYNWRVKVISISASHAQVSQNFAREASHVLKQY